MLGRDSIWGVSRRGGAWPLLGAGMGFLSAAVVGRGLGDCGKEGFGIPWSTRKGRGGRGLRRGRRVEAGRWKGSREKVEHEPATIEIQSDRVGEQKWGSRCPWRTKARANFR